MSYELVGTKIIISINMTQSYALSRQTYSDLLIKSQSCFKTTIDDHVYDLRI